MATTHTAAQAYHGATDGLAADTITISGQWKRFRIMNRGTADLFFNVVNGTAVPTVAVARADNTICVPGSTILYGFYEDLAFGKNVPGIVVSIISAAVCNYSIEGLPA